MCVQLKSENILFEIVLSSTFWDMPPRAQILVNDICKFDGDVNESSKVIKFYHQLEFEKSQKLIINRYNKTVDQCRNGQDQIMMISKIVIDGVDINNFILSKATFTPEYPEPWASQQISQGLELETELYGETWLGHNGQWCFNFASPFWKFLIMEMS